MGRGSRDRSIERHVWHHDRDGIFQRSTLTVEGYSVRIRPALARRMVRQLLRIAPRSRRKKWVESRAVANLSDSAPVGESVEAHSFVALLSDNGEPDQSGR